MPSAPTIPRSPAADSLPRPHAGEPLAPVCPSHWPRFPVALVTRRPRCTMRQALHAGWSFLLVAMLLAGCASGSAEDARRGERRQAARGVLLPQEQATANAERFDPGTPTPVPTLPPMPVLEAFELTLNVDASGAPQGAYGGIPADAGRVYATALLRYLQPGQQVTATLRLPDDTVLLSSSFDVTTATDRAWIALPLEMNGTLAPGDYALWLAIDDQSVNSLVVQVTGFGTAPRQLSGGTSSSQPARPTEGGFSDPSQDVPSGGPTIEPVPGDQ